MPSALSYEDVVELGELACRELPASRLQLGGREIRTANLPHLTNLDQIVEHAERVGDRHVRVWHVQLIEIDVVGSQTAQAVLDGLPHILRFGPLAAVAEIRFVVLPCVFDTSRTSIAAAACGGADETLDGNRSIMMRTSGR